jgi:hypothetical protein
MNYQSVPKYKMFWDILYLGTEGVFCEVQQVRMLFVHRVHFRASWSCEKSH